MTATTTTFEAQRAALADVVAIPVTPFAEDGSIDQDTHRALLRRALDGGVRIVTPNGNTGEFYALSPEERRLVTELTVDEARGGPPSWSGSDTTCRPPSPPPATPGSSVPRW